MLIKGQVQTDIAMVKIKGGGTNSSNRIAIRKMFDENKKCSLRVFV